MFVGFMIETKFRERESKNKIAGLFEDICQLRIRRVVDFSLFKTFIGWGLFFKSIQEQLILYIEVFVFDLTHFFIAKYVRCYCMICLWVGVLFLACFLC